MFTPKSPPIFTTDDARRIARRRLPRMVFDFIDGAAGFEQTPERNRTALETVQLQPRVLEDVTTRSLKTSFLGTDYALPFGVSPMGMCALACPNADQHLGEAGKTRGMPVCLSTAGSARIEDMADWAQDMAWFQLYLVPPMDHTMRLIERAKDSGYTTLVLTVDVPQISRRVRDLRNGFQSNFKIGPRQFVDLALHPVWSLATLRAGIPQAANFLDHAEQAFNRSTPRTGATWDFLAKLRDMWPHKLIVKGVTDPRDAHRIAATGADAIWVSNHGGRQLDSAPGAADCLRSIRAELGPDFPLVFDSGVRSGDDVLRALALGADFVMMGRPFLFALGAAGQTGLSVFIDEFTAGLDSAMAQIGVTDIQTMSAAQLVGSERAIA